jgi:FkbM family methyltransferase
LPGSSSLDTKKCCSIEKKIWNNLKLRTHSRQQSEIKMKIGHGTFSICFLAAAVFHASLMTSEASNLRPDVTLDPKTVENKEPAACHCEEKEQKAHKPRPLMVFPLLKELKAGWGNMQEPQLLLKKAEGTRSLVVDVGLDRGREFFKAIENGFEVVGFEPNPESFAGLAERCRALVTTECYVFEDVSTVQRPLQREPGASYLINAAVGAEPGEMELLLRGAASSFQAPKTAENAHKWKMVPIVKIDDFIQENVYLFKIDTQGHDPLVITGASNLFKNHVVRQLIWEVEPLTMARNNVSLTDTMSMLQDYGMLCFNERSDATGRCGFWGDTVDQFEKQFFGPDNVDVNGPGLWADCWEDFLCINIEKSYPGMALESQ